MKTAYTAIQLAGAVLLLLTAGASDAGLTTVGEIAYGLAVSGLLVGVGTMGKRPRARRVVRHIAKRV